MPPLYRILEIVLYSLLNFLPYILLALYPFRNKLRFSHKATGILIFFVTIIQIVLGVWAGLIPGSNTGLISAVSTLTYFVFYFTAVNVQFTQTLFTLLFLSNIANLVVMLSKCIEGLICPELAWQSYRWSFSAAMLLVELLVLVPLFIYFKRFFSKAFEVDTARPTWRFLWLIPATFYIIWYYHLYGSNMSSLELALQPANSFFLIVINLGGMMIYHLVVNHIIILDDNVNLARKNHELVTQNLQYNNLQARIAEARQAKHDIRHHATLMKSYIQSKEYDKLEIYLDGYIDTLPDDTPIAFCKNSAVNVLLSYFASQAKMNHIEFSAKLHVPEESGIPGHDLSVLLGNLLENALDACISCQSDNRSIVLKAKTNGSVLFLTIDNTFDGIIRQDKSGRYLSTKANGSGLGLASVKSIVERYNGSIDIHHEDEMFRVSIMMNLPNL